MTLRQPNIERMLQLSCDTMDFLRDELRKDAAAGLGSGLITATR